ncbi:DNA polymerase I [Peredibacter starrii]|uniref:DNA polymerase I n=1 Tax=Peredibacter starrii TaxID=28202 RepID=A0AAX4HS65_9BACT|nr:DNA polymerase I [Peredibacter starrii]WPU65754.1 DNA polymerase I [Peredibacter starrii]
MKKLIIIDISNYIFRAFFAIRPLHAPDGTPVNAVYGVLSMVHNLIVKYQPTHIIVARDTKEGSFRKVIYTEYKANRSAPPDELVPQFPLVDELIQVLGLPEIKAPNYEADDVIGSVATQWKNDFDEILIASGDKDLMQFVDGPIKILDTMKEKIYSREDVKDKMGVYPEQIVDYLSLIGDSSDNIPGVDGIGPKGAQNLIEEFGTLENILENIPSIKNKRSMTALDANKDNARLSKELVKIVCDLKLKYAPDESSYRLKVNQEVEDFLNKVGFRSWLTKLADFKIAEPSAAKTHVVPEKTEAKAVELWTLADLKKNIQGEDTIALTHICDDELNQHQCWRAMAVATSKKTGYIALSSEEAKTLIDIIHEAHALVVCYQSKPILQLAMVAGVTPDFKYFDLAQAHFIINPEMRHDLATMVEEFLGYKLPVAPKGQADLFGNQSEEEIKIQGERVEAILKLYPILRDKMKEMNVERPYDELDIPLIKVLAAMELEGVSLDVPFYKNLENDFSRQIEEIEAEVVKAAGDKINLRSPKQVGELLFEKLQLPVIRKTKTGYSTDAEVLNELAALKLNPIPELLLRYREIEKLLSTYVKALPTMVSPDTKKIHTHFQPSNAATGRLSSDNPNLQNIPVRTENGRKLRKGFIPSPGRTLLSADYSQVELRLLAHFAQDKNMIDAFQNDRDIHRQTAAEVFDVPLEQVSKDMRNSAKAINFGLMYGQTSFGLSQALHISQGDAKKYITNYFKKFHSVKSYLDGLKEKAENTGYAETLFGRKRNLPDIKSTNRQVKAMAERVAINSPIQGTAADIIKLAMINIQRILAERKLKSKMILQVHDELIFDVVPEELEEMKVLVQEQMEGAVSLSVQLKVEMGTGSNWYDLK